MIQTFSIFRRTRMSQKGLKIMCGYKSTESQLMLTAAIRKESTIVSFTLTKIESSILIFLPWNFAIKFISFSKGKELNNEFGEWHRDVCFFWSYLHETSSIGKKQRQKKQKKAEERKKNKRKKQKCVTMESFF